MAKMLVSRAHLPLGFSRMVLSWSSLSVPLAGVLIFIQYTCCCGLYSAVGNDPALLWVSEFRSTSGMGIVSAIYMRTTLTTVDVCHFFFFFPKMRLQKENAVVVSSVWLFGWQKKTVAKKGQYLTTIGNLAALYYSLFKLLSMEKLSCFIFSYKTVKCQCKMVRLERRLCSLILWDWHQKLTFQEKRERWARERKEEKEKREKANRMLVHTARYMLTHGSLRHS